VYEEIAQNRRRTVLLMLGAVVFLGAVGYAIGLYFDTGPTGLVIAAVLALGLALASYFGGDKVVLASA
jgi:heat shock protein HtpX